MLIEQQRKIYSLARERAVEILMERNPFQHPELAVVCLGGSLNSNSHGLRSDIDITTVMKPHNPNKVDADAIITLGNQLKVAFQEAGIPAVFISTIRLEEAQIAMAEMMGKKVIPIHWLHYPSVEFAAANEPPELFRGLLEGQVLSGKRETVLADFEKVDTTSISHLHGLDWLTDSFKVLVTNIDNEEESSSLQPESFLKGLAMHNLEYFWKWNIIAKMTKERGGCEFKNWSDAEQCLDRLSTEIWKTASQIREIRHMGKAAPINEIIALHKITFELWPI